MGKKKKKTILNTVKNAEIHVTVPENTDEINPLKFSVPGFRTEKTEAGVATIQGKKALYIRLRIRGGD
ncbi:MAG: hypothetical protein WC382_02825 [Methanoregulaceae archaeon]|jgi:hypothetical protein